MVIVAPDHLLARKAGDHLHRLVHPHEAQLARGLDEDDVGHVVHDRIEEAIETLRRIVIGGGGGHGRGSRERTPGAPARAAPAYYTAGAWGMLGTFRAAERPLLRGSFLGR